MNTLRAISLHQPHASFVAYGFKPYETRHWRTDYTGPLLIHAALRRMDRSDEDLAREIFGDRRPLPYGAFVCVTNMVRCLDAEITDEEYFGRSNGLGDFSAGRFAWEMSDVMRFVSPPRAFGHQRFWNVPIKLSEHAMIPEQWRAA